MKEIIRIHWDNKWWIALEFKLADLWIGAYWDREKDGGDTHFHIWVCLLPCLPVHLSIRRRELV
jgi:hypothetical protein